MSIRIRRVVALYLAAAAATVTLLAAGESPARASAHHDPTICYTPPASLQRYWPAMCILPSS